jgi:hypothetical protein
MDTSDAGYSYIRHLDAGAAAQDTLRGADHQWLGPHPAILHGDDLRIAQQDYRMRARGIRGSTRDKHTPGNQQDTQPPPVVQPNVKFAGPGWAQSGPSQKTREDKGRRGVGAAQRPPQQHAHRGAAMGHVTQGGKHKNKNDNQRNHQQQQRYQQLHHQQPHWEKHQQQNSKTARSYEAQQRIPYRTKHQPKSFQNKTQVASKDKLPFQKSAGQAGASGAAAPAFKNPFLMKMKGRKLAAAAEGPPQSESPELHGLSSDEGSEGTDLAFQQLSELFYTGTNVLRNLPLHTSKYLNSVD